MQRPSRHALALICIAALITLAGCSGATPGQSDGTDTGDSEDELTSLDQQLLQDHTLTLLNAGNYTAFLTTTESGSSSTTVAAADISARSRYDQITTSGLSIEEYRPANSETLYQQVGSGSSANYYSKSAPNNFTASEITAPYLITDVTYQQFGTDTIDGTTVQRYVANDVSSLNVSSDEWGGSFVTNISSTVLVDPDRRLIYEIDANYTVQTTEGDTINSSYTLRYSNVGSTTVTEPDWLSQAT